MINKKRILKVLAIGLFLILSNVIFIYSQQTMTSYTYRWGNKAAHIQDTTCACSGIITNCNFIADRTNPLYCRNFDDDYYVNATSQCYSNTCYTAFISVGPLFIFTINHTKYQSDCNCISGSWITSVAPNYCSKIKLQTIRWADLNDREINKTNKNSRINILLNGWEHPETSKRIISSTYIEYQIFNSSNHLIDTIGSFAGYNDFARKDWFAHTSGLYYIKARIQGEAGWVDSSSTPLYGILNVTTNEYNSPPVAKIESPNSSVLYVTGASIYFNQSSYDIDSYFNWSWNLGDGTIKEGGNSDPLKPNYNFTYSYSVGGQTDVKLNLFDEQGARDSDQVSIMIVDLSIRAIYVFAEITEPYYGRINNGSGVKFNANNTFAINVTGTGQVQCLGGNCPIQIFGGGGVIVQDPYSKRGNYDSLNFSWTFDDSVKYNSIGINGYNFSKVFNPGEHTTDLQVFYTGSGDNSSVSTSFQVNMINLCESGGLIWWDGNGMEHETTIEDSNACSGIDLDPNTVSDNCCPGAYDCTVGASPGCQLDPIVQQYCLNISYCSDYKDIGNCTLDRCQMGGDSTCGSFSLNNNKTVCGDSNFLKSNCSCAWDLTTSSCVEKAELIGTIFNDSVEVRHICTTNVSHDNCTDLGFMRINKISKLTWDPNTILELISKGYATDQTDAINQLNAKCNVTEMCASGEGTVICGSSVVKLSFFTITNVIIAIIVIIIIYFFIHVLRKNKKKR